jgi:hypothetical protein
MLLSFYAFKCFLKWAGWPIVGPYFEITVKYTELKFCVHSKLNIKDENV